MLTTLSVIQEFCLTEEVETKTPSRWYSGQPWQHTYKTFNFLIVNLCKLLIFPWVISETKIHSCVSQFKAIVEKNKRRFWEIIITKKKKEIANYFSVDADVPGRLFHKVGMQTPWLCSLKVLSSQKKLSLKYKDVTQPQIYSPGISLLSCLCVENRQT